MKKLLLAIISSLCLLSCEKSIAEDQTTSEAQEIANMISDVELLYNSEAYTKVFGKSAKLIRKKPSIIIVKNLRNEQLLPIVMTESEEFEYSLATVLDLVDKKKIKDKTGGYVVTCNGGSQDGMTTNTSSKMEAAKAVSSCFDGGGCAEVCLALSVKRVQSCVEELRALLSTNAAVYSDLHVDDNSFLRLNKAIKNINIKDTDKFSAAGVLPNL